MFGGAGVLTGVCVLRLITTPDVATAETEAEMDPGVPDGQALAATGATRLHLPDRFEVFARW
jgi:hypothetical protein